MNLSLSETETTWNACLWSEQVLLIYQPCFILSYPGTCITGDFFSEYEIHENILFLKSKLQMGDGANVVLLWYLRSICLSFGHVFHYIKSLSPTYLIASKAVPYIHLSIYQGWLYQLSWHLGEWSASKVTHQILNSSICVRFITNTMRNNINGQGCGTVNTLRPRQNDRHFPDDIFKCIFFNENVGISIKILFLLAQLTISQHWFRCGEYGWVLWASWPRREPRYAGN